MDWITPVNSSGRFIAPASQKQAFCVETKLRKKKNVIPDVNGVRIVPYNVHFWKGPLGTWITKTNNLDSVVSVLEKLDADVVCLQEVTNRLDWRTPILSMGYDICEPDSKHDGTFNVILSRLGFKSPTNNWIENRPEISCHIPGVGLVMNIHPDVVPGRFRQIQKSLKSSEKVSGPVFLCGDFNSTRDELCVEHYTFNDPNEYTNWTGKEIDFIISRGLISQACGIMYDASSDHLPVWVDVFQKNY